jgi:hypothetical protein
VRCVFLSKNTSDEIWFRLFISKRGGGEVYIERMNLLITVAPIFSIYPSSMEYRHATLFRRIGNPKFTRRLCLVPDSHGQGKSIDVPFEM